MNLSVYFLRFIFLYYSETSPEANPAEALPGVWKSF
jgi:hypothetical protein